jgi:predicted MFS family arabinose efflux permease
VLFAALNVLGFERFHSAGWTGAFYAAFGAGAAAGSVLTFKIVRRFDPLKLSAVVIVAEVLPLWVLPGHLPGAAIAVALFLAGVGIPVVNAPMMGVLTARTPGPLRAKVLTAVMTFATIAGPLGLIGAGPVLESIGPRWVFVIVASGLTFSSLFFAAVALRALRTTPVPAEA